MLLKRNVGSIFVRRFPPQHTDCTYAGFNFGHFHKNSTKNAVNSIFVKNSIGKVQKLDFWLQFIAHIVQK